GLAVFVKATVAPSDVIVALAEAGPESKSPVGRSVTVQLVPVGMPLRAADPDPSWVVIETELSPSRSKRLSLQSTSKRNVPSPPTVDLEIVRLPVLRVLVKATTLVPRAIVTPAAVRPDWTLPPAIVKLVDHLLAPGSLSETEHTVPRGMSSISLDPPSPSEKARASP